MSASAHTTLSVTTCGHRRFCLLEVEPRKFDSYDAKVAYFEQLAQERDNGGLEALMHVLLNHDTSSFCATRRPQAALEAMVNQKLMNCSAVQAFVHDLLAKASESTFPSQVSKAQLHNMFNDFAMASGQGQKLSGKLFITQLRLHAPSGYFIRTIKMANTNPGSSSGASRAARVNGWVLPRLLEWRRDFEGAQTRTMTIAMAMDLLLDCHKCYMCGSAGHNVIVPRHMCNTPPTKFESLHCRKNASDSCQSR